MSFCSLNFIFFFLPVFVLIHGLCRGKLRNLVLFVGSVVFYWFCSGESVEPISILIISVCITYISGIAISYAKNSFLRKFVFVFTVVADVASLLFFKYSVAVLSNATGIFRFSFEDILMPIGFSFYIFKSISYLNEVRSGDTKAEESLINFGAYMTFFPQIVMGPIQTYKSMKKTLNERKVTFSGINEGLAEFIIGLGLKEIFAENFATVWSGVERYGIESISTPFAWLGLIAFSMQIYFDFYGYSLMSLGIAEMLGFETPVNFAHPYAARSVSEFFRKWHITLYDWYRENIYYSLGGSRCSKIKTYRNMFIVWLLTGIWHGDSINFWIWGMFLFAVTAIERTGALDFAIKNKVLSRIYLMPVIMFSWLIFKIDVRADFFAYVSRLVPLSALPDYVNANDWIPYIKSMWWLFAAGILFVTPVPRRIYTKYKEKQYITVPVLIAIFWYSVYCSSLGASNPFLYTRF